MEPYVDEAFYNDEFMGEHVESKDFTRFAKRASDVIDALTGWQILKIGLDKFTEDVQILIKKACCAQIEYYQLEGIELDATGNTESSGSVSISGFSYSGRSSEGRQNSRAAPSCLTYLEGTGLLRKKGVRIGII
ncbi:hypothetical protein [Lactococcus formosensis]|uniref:hypothetical protein n=1 Tax=Lactococcus formosensis TaxID=1281486 RepID=UPI00254C3E89|nr:hypothetical protein [Lactococcus formosensis]